MRGKVRNRMGVVGMVVEGRERGGDRGRKEVGGFDWGVN